MKKSKHLKKKERRKSQIIQNILLIIFIIMFIYSTYKVVMYVIETNNNKKLNNELVEKAISFETENTETENILPLKVDFSVLKQQNQDIVGWIYSENTPINFPILQSKDNQYYLRRLITGKYNRAGSIFMDYRNDANLSNSNTIIYGHNMKNDTMFGTLPNYRKQEYYNEHKNMYLFTPEKNYIVKLFTGFTESVNSDIYNLHSIKEDEINKLKSKSDFKSNVEFTEDSRILTMSTCAYEYEGARYIVMGILEEVP